MIAGVCCASTRGAQRQNENSRQQIARNWLLVPGISNSVRKACDHQSLLSSRLSERVPSISRWNALSSTRWLPRRCRLEFIFSVDAPKLMPASFQGVAIVLRTKRSTDGSLLSAAGARYVSLLNWISSHRTPEKIKTDFRSG